MEQLDRVKERKDKFISRLFMIKLELFFEQPENYFHKCVHCHQLYTIGQAEV